MGKGDGGEAKKGWVCWADSGMGEKMVMRASRRWEGEGERGNDLPHMQWRGERGRRAGRVCRRH